MISREDFIDYLNQMIRIENEMEAIYVKLVQDLQQPGYKQVFSGLVEAERLHARQLDDLTSIFFE